MKDIRERTFEFALRIIRLSQQLEEQAGVARISGLQSEADELTRIIGSIIVSAKRGTK